MIERLKEAGLELAVVINDVDGVDMGLSELRATGVRVDEYEGWLQR